MQKLVTEILARSIDFVQVEQLQAEAAVKQLPDQERRKLVDAYGDDFAWRGVVSDNFWLLWSKLAEAALIVDPGADSEANEQTVEGEDDEDAL